MAKTFDASHRVTYAECTIGDHVYYGRYLDILESARGQFFRHLGMSFLEWQRQGTIFPIIECRLCYKAPARYDDLLKIELGIPLAAGIRLNFNYRILGEDGALLVEAETRHVCAGSNDKPKRLPPDLVEPLKPYMAQAKGHGHE